MSRLLITLTALNLSVFSSIIWAEPISIIAISSDQFPFEGANQFLGTETSIQLLNLDSVDRIERQLSQGLPANETQAKALTQERIAKIGQEKLNEDVRSAYLPLATMMSYGLNRYPVIIFDQQTVVYGVTNVPAAFGHYRNWKLEQKGKRYE